MRLRRLACLLRAAFLGAGAPAFAQEAAPACAGRDLSLDPSLKIDLKAHADELVNGEGLFWRVDRKGLAPSWLYGTMHSTQPSALALAREASGAIATAKSVATELGGPFELSEKVNLSSTMLAAALDTNADTLAGVPPEELPQVEAFLTQHGFPKEMAHHLKAWFLAAATSLPACETEGQSKGLPEMDDSLARMAKADHVPVIALESVDEQLKALSSLSPDLSLTLVRAAAHSPQLNDDGYMTMLQLYLRKEPTLAVAVLDAMPDLTPQERAAEAEFTKQLLVGRNATMVERAEPLLAKGGAFIAVGALHLSGREGLVERLRAAGYSVTKVW